MTDQYNTRLAVSLGDELDNSSQVADRRHKAPLGGERELVGVREAGEGFALDRDLPEVIPMRDLRVALHLGDVEAMVIFEEVRAAVDRPRLERSALRRAADEGS